MGPCSLLPGCGPAAGVPGRLGVAGGTLDIVIQSQVDSAASTSESKEPPVGMRRQVQWFYASALRSCALKYQAVFLRTLLGWMSERSDGNS